ncbi:MAG: replication-associated recombination protein A, partial [Verrucomicrobia bacterium]|nr:replication-associated recombination protein A [Verrucomicrobiota bacterium]
HYVGQKHLVEAPNGLLYRIIKKGRPHSVVFWGPPGCGKTSLAKLYLKSFSRPVETISATSSATQDFRRIIDQVQSAPLLYKPTLLWIDEVHRLTRPQQDILLQSIENGSLIIVAATTENPSFQLAPALISRVQVMTMRPLEEHDLLRLITRVETELNTFTLTPEAKTLLCRWANGDARALLNWLEQLSGPVTAEELPEIISRKRACIDPTGEGRYQLISALHKAVRGSDCQAALYWLSRQLTAGEDARYLARRLVRMASEDIGLADPAALSIALDGLRAYEALGSPEGDLALAQVVIYLALAPKSNAIYTAFGKAKEDATETSQLAPPPHLINAVTKWMQKEGYGQNYLYDHDCPNGFSGQNFFPEQMGPREYYVPVERGFERELHKRLAYFCKLKEHTT